VFISNEERIMDEGSWKECQHGDKNLKKY